MVYCDQINCFKKVQCVGKEKLTLKAKSHRSEFGLSALVYSIEMVVLHGGLHGRELALTVDIKGSFIQYTTILIFW